MPQPIAEGITPWPDELVARYVARGHWGGRPFGACLAERSDAAPEAVAVVDGDLRLTYGELMARADGAAERLAALGLGLVTGCWCSSRTAGSWSSLVELAEPRAIAVPDTWRGFDHRQLAHQLAASSPSLEHVRAPRSTSSPSARLPSTRPSACTGRRR